MAVAFAVTVIATRTYLELTGFPQLGGGKLHLAHAIWGGLLLMVGAVLPLVYAPSRVLTLSAALAGVGGGLFIDEVGKFLTSDNDYFFAPAAPIIYLVGLVLMLLVVRARGSGQHSTTADWYEVLDRLGETVEGRTDSEDLADLQQRLSRVAGAPGHPEVSALAATMLTSVSGWSVPEHSPGWPGRTARWLDRADRRVVPAVTYGFLGFLATIVLGINGLLFGAFATWLFFDSQAESILFDPVTSGGLYSEPVARTVLAVAMVGSAYVLFAAVASALSRLRGRSDRAAVWGVRSCVAVLVVVDLAASYVDINLLVLLMLLQLLCLGVFLRYRVRRADRSVRGARTAASTRSTPTDGVPGPPLIGVDEVSGPAPE
jgi:hypothetical protein